jgi:hypothetical protein
MNEAAKNILEALDKAPKAGKKALKLSFTVCYSNSKEEGYAHCEYLEGLWGIVLRAQLSFKKPVKCLESEYFSDIISDIISGEDIVTPDNISKLSSVISLGSDEHNDAKVSMIYGEISNVAHFKIEKVLSVDHFKINSEPAYIARIFDSTKPSSTALAETDHSSDPFKLLCQVIEKLVEIEEGYELALEIKSLRSRLAHLERKQSATKDEPVRDLDPNELPCPSLYWMS